MMRRLALLLGLFLLGGCAAARSATNAWLGVTHLPGQGVTSNVAYQWNCDPDAVKRAAATYHAELPRGRRYVPQVGWNACELLARVGAPRESERQQTVAGRSASLWYGTAADPALVTLELDEQRQEWRVSYVGWN